MGKILDLEPRFNYRINPYTIFSCAQERIRIELKPSEGSLICSYLSTRIMSVQSE